MRSCEDAASNSHQQHVLSIFKLRKSQTLCNMKLRAHTCMPSLVGKAASISPLSKMLVITPIEPLEMPFSPSMLFVRNITFAPRAQTTVEAKFVPLLKTLESSTAEILSPFSKSSDLETIIGFSDGIPESTA